MALGVATARFLEDGQEILDQNRAACLRPTPDRVVAGWQEFALMLKAVEELHPQQRRAFVMRRFDEAGYDESAQHLGVSFWTAKGYVKESLRHIRSRLAETRS